MAIAGQTSEPAPASRQYTKEQFEKAIIGKTKVEIRALFGSPKEAQNSSKWYYFPPPIFDAEAGKPAAYVVL
jgi:hypothetical protein